MNLFASCREVRERLTEYEEGTLSRHDRAAVWLHLLICTACEAFYQGLRALPKVARLLLGVEEPPPAEAGQALEGALRKLGGHRH